MKEKMSAKHWLVLIAMCGLAGSSIGVAVNTAGVFYTPIAQDLGAGRGSISLTLTIMVVASSFVGLMIPSVLKEKTLKPIIITATVLLAGGTFLLSLCDQLWLLYAVNVVRGIGAGMIGFVLSTTVINSWFLKNHGLFTSIVMAFSGLPGVFLSSVFSSVIASGGWRKGYVMMALVMVLFNLPAILCPVTIKPEKQGLKPYGYEEYLQQKSENKITVVQETNTGVSYLSAEFLLAVLYAALVAIIFGATSHLPGFAEAAGMGAAVGALMLSVGNAANVVSKLFFGVICDRLGSKMAIVTMASVSIAGMLLLLFVPQAWAMLAGAFLFGFTAPNSAVGLVVLSTDLFGLANYRRVYPVISFVCAMTSAVAVTLLGVLYDLTQSYYVMFTALAVIQACVILTVLSIFYIHKKDKEETI